MRKTGFDLCRKIHAKLLSEFPRRRFKESELEDVIGYTVGLDKRTFVKYRMWLFRFGFIRTAKNFHGGVLKTPYGETIYEIVNKRHKEHNKK